MLSFVQVIYVEDTFNSDEAEGVRLTEELTVGKQMAGGTQVSCSPVGTSCCGGLHECVPHCVYVNARGVLHNMLAAHES